MLQGLAQRSDNGSSSGSVISDEVARGPPMQLVTIIVAYQKTWQPGESRSEHECS